MARNFLNRTGYADWLTIKIHQGKEKSLAFVNTLPPSDEKEMLKSFLRTASKWVVIIGYDGTSVKWSDIAHNGAKSRIEAEFIVQNFKS
jgi:hypothetical protein